MQLTPDRKLYWYQPETVVIVREGADYPYVRQTLRRCSPVLHTPNGRPRFRAWFNGTEIQKAGYLEGKTVCLTSGGTIFSVARIIDDVPYFWSNKATPKKATRSYRAVTFVGGIVAEVVFDSGQWYVKGQLTKEQQRLLHKALGGNVIFVDSEDEVLPPID